MKNTIKTTIYMVIAAMAERNCQSGMDATAAAALQQQVRHAVRCTQQTMSTVRDRLRGAARATP